MANETKAEEVWRNDITGEYMEPDHDDFTLGLWIPGLTAAEAREWLPDVIAWASDYEVSDWARTLLAKLPEEEK